MPSSAPPIHTQNDATRTAARQSETSYPLPKDLRAPRRSLPAVDERLVAPESRYEIEDGHVLYVAATDAPHGARHSKLSALVEAHTSEDYQVASDMLTRLTEIDDIAPDVSVFPVEPDRDTGGRQLEEVAFEVVDSQTMSHVATRAAKLVARGVRRVFATDARRDIAFEWSGESGSWVPLDAASFITDRVFASPLPVATLVGSSRVDDAVALALLHKRNPILRNALERGKAEGLAEGLARGKAEGLAQGKVEALLMLLLSRRLIPTDSEHRRILGASSRQLDTWLRNVIRCGSVDELLRK